MQDRPCCGSQSGDHDDLPIFYFFLLPKQNETLLTASWYCPLQSEPDRMGAQQGKEAGAGGRSPHLHHPQVAPHHHHHQPHPNPPLAGRLGERQGSRIKGLRSNKARVGGNVFTEHSGEYQLSFQQ